MSIACAGLHQVFRIRITWKVKIGSEMRKLIVLSQVTIGGVPGETPKVTNILQPA